VLTILQLTPRLRPAMCWTGNGTVNQTMALHRC
jgi:hypothetical protein